MNRRRAITLVGTGGLAVAGGMSTPTPTPALQLSVAIHDLYESDGKLSMPATLRKDDYGFEFNVVLENISLVDQFVWTGDNSLGYDTFWFEVVTEDGTRTTIRRPMAAFGKNWPRLSRLAPGEKYVRIIQHDSPSGKVDQWNFPFDSKNAKRLVTIQAFFEQPKGDLAGKLAIYTGRITSPIYKVVLWTA